MGIVSWSTAIVANQLSSTSARSSSALVSSTPWTCIKNLKRKQCLKLTKSSPLFENIQTLINNKQLDKIYGFNQDVDGSWRYGKEKLIFNRDNTMQIGNMKLKMTPGLFELVFHKKPLHYSKNDLKKYKEILINTNAHKRRYEPNEQVKGTRAFKYIRIIKHLFETTTNI